MPEFVCRLGAPDGSVVEQRRLAVSAEAVRRELEGEGYHVFSVTPARARLNLAALGRRERVRPRDFLVFNTQLRTLLRAGLPLAQSLELLRDQQEDPTFRALLAKVHEKVTTGSALSDAFLSLGEAVPRMYANTLRAGERSGDLAGVLGRYIGYQKVSAEARKKIVSALTYPAVLVTLSIGLVVILMTYVIPKFTDFYAGLGGVLPLPTRIVVGVATFAHDNALLLAAGTTGLALGLRLWARTPGGRRRVHRWVLRVPVVGRLLKLFGLSQFVRSLAVLLEGGTPVVPALETAATSVGNVHMSERFLACVPEVREGQALSDSLSRTGLVPELGLAMVRVGESTGALGEMLNHTADFFDADIDLSLGRLVTLFEPIVLVFMALVVAGLLLAVYYPLLALVSQIQ